jgi:hypothetical protein
MNNFEQLIEYVINDDEAKARELFHQIVVDKSRAIYEELMNQEEDLEEAVEEEDLEEDLEEGMDGVPTTGDASDDLIDDIEAEEEGMTFENDAEFDDEAEEAGEEETADIEGEGDLEDRVVDLEDKLDELMAEFEAMMGDEAGEDHGDDVGDEAGGDAIEVDDTQAEFPMDSEEEMMAENVALKAAPKPVTSEDGGVNKKSTVAANSGARGAVAKPVHTGANEGGHHDSSAYKNATKDLIGKVGNTPAQGTQKPSAAPKPVTTQQAAGVNDRSPVPRG